MLIGSQCLSPFESPTLLFGYPVYLAAVYMQDFMLGHGRTTYPREQPAAIAGLGIGGTIKDVAFTKALMVISDLICVGNRI